MQADTTGVVRRMAAALDAKPWAEAAALVDRRDLERFAEAQVAELRHLETAPRMSDAMRRRSSLSPAAVERFAAHEEETRRAHRARFADMYGGRDTSEELRQLTPETLLLLWLTGFDPVAQVRRSVAHVERLHPGFASSALQAEPSFRREIVGTNYEGGGPRACEIPGVDRPSR